MNDTLSLSQSPTRIRDRSIFRSTSFSMPRRSTVVSALLSLQIRAHRLHQLTIINLSSSQQILSVWTKRSLRITSSRSLSVPSPLPPPSSRRSTFSHPGQPATEASTSSSNPGPPPFFLPLLPPKRPSRKTPSPRRPRSFEPSSFLARRQSRSALG